MSKHQLVSFFFSTKSIPFILPCADFLNQTEEKRSRNFASTFLFIFYV
ncbi:hypothetical protein HMPREF0813_00411 [Streptococcus anginosus F0211]|uniref:Uncharacterized protein n=1 Tax=Streptococcus anginosus F0211 TaxID=706437 RepID=E6IZJ6_STRAP|nr:hypothetical protein HMPREF0813_00411 [Streptococcus anginosus F0211]